MFKFETRDCPDCGRPFEALEFWDGDAPCDKCGTARYEARVRAINDGRAYSVTSIGGACPTQAEGITAEGRPYYFRARHGQWTLDVGKQGWPNYRGWPREDVWGENQIAEGEDPSNGFMEDADVLAILDKYLPAI